MKKLLAMVLALCVVFSFAACGKDAAKEEKKTESKATDVNDVKVGFIFLHDENSTYDKNFMDGAKAATKALGLSDDQVIFKANVPEGNECYEAAADLADQGCSAV
ncbi:MAG: BMP family ABC transporter substrate-binding protein, partial [Clostridia bacterium]|nr:BMP family ABC transporter substrate-binding protein [Clostridia bacterium]